MGYQNEKLWGEFLNKVQKEDQDLQPEHRIGEAYICAVRNICNYGIQRAKTIRDTFPMFTLHDETHICNVMGLMWNLLGEDSKNLTRDEAAMLILAACCHDIGMSYSEEEKEELFQDTDRLNQYLDQHHGEYVKAYSSGNSAPTMTKDMIQNYLRCIHHERVMDLLYQIEWPGVLVGKVDRQSLIEVCQSHGRDIGSLDNMEGTATLDLRFCAILLRLADILDFDTSRAPQAVYEYSGFENANAPAAVRSKEEWDKHLSSYGFDFLHILQRSYLYTLDYHAKCRSMQIEQTVNCYLDWVEEELQNCGKQLRRFAGKWQSFVLPGKLNRKIISEGYVSGQYRLSLEQDKILELLVGEDLYGDSAVFVRELIQNAIDAVRTREQLDKSLPSDWKGQIHIRCWRDEEGYHWFRIEDNGIGMTEEVIKNYFLKIGSSYYSSDSFLRSKLKCNADPDYMPISRFGIGILSCFMGDKQTNQVEVSTKHFKEGDTYYPALRLSMYGINGYYYLADRDKKHMPGPMKGITQKEKEPYLRQAGTVIAVRTNLYQTSRYRSFKDIVDQYVCFPPVAIHYDGEEGSFDYPTESELMDWAHEIQPLESLEEEATLTFAIPDEELEKLYQERPEICFKENPKLLLKIIPLDYYTSKPYLKGVLVTARVEGEHDPIRLKFGNREKEVRVIVEIMTDENRDKLGIKINLDFETMELFTGITKEWDFEICNLSEFEWYVRYFSRIKNFKMRYGVKAHNGILYQSEYLFPLERAFYRTIGKIMLLKDKYRPYLDISRDKVRSLPLEAECEIAIIEKNIFYHFFAPEYSNFVYSYRDYSEITMKEYCELLKDRDDLTVQLTFQTREGLLSNEDLQNKLSEKGSIEYWLHTREDLYNCLCVAFLRERYLLQIDSSFNLILIRKKERELSEEYKELFPAGLFLPPAEKSNRFLNSKERNLRICCNEEHRLSQFMIQNGVKLKKYFPRIFEELLRVLAESDGDELIETVNSLLTHLRNLPERYFEISDDLFLTEKDFVKHMCSSESRIEV